MANLAKFGPMLAKFSKLGPDVAKLGQIIADLGGRRAKRSQKLLLGVVFELSSSDVGVCSKRVSGDRRGRD